MNEPCFYQYQGDNLLLHCQAQPGSGKTEFAGLINNRLKIRIKARAIDGEANKTLVAFIANAFDCSKSSVELIKGEKQKLKTLRISKPRHLPNLGGDLHIAPNAMA